MLRHEGDRFLDDVTPQQVEQQVGIPVRVVPVDVYKRQEHHRLAAALQHRRHIHIVRGHAVGYAGHQHNDVCLLDR